MKYDNKPPMLNKEEVKELDMMILKAGFPKHYDKTLCNADELSEILSISKRKLMIYHNLGFLPMSSGTNKSTTPRVAYKFLKVAL